MKGVNSYNITDLTGLFKLEDYLIDTELSICFSVNLGEGIT